MTPTSNLWLVGALVELAEGTTNCKARAPRAFGFHVERIPIERAPTVFLFAASVCAQAVVELMVGEQGALFVTEAKMRLLVTHAFTRSMREEAMPLAAHKVTIPRSEAIQVHFAWQNARQLPAAPIGSEANVVHTIGKERAILVTDPKEQFLVFTAIHAWGCDIMN